MRAWLRVAKRDWSSNSHSRVAATMLPAGQVGQGPEQRMSPVHLDMPVDAHHQRTRTLQLAAHRAREGCTCNHDWHNR